MDKDKAVATRRADAATVAKQKAQADAARAKTKSEEKAAVAKEKAQEVAEVDLHRSSQHHILALRLFVDSVQCSWLLRVCNSYWKRSR